MEQTPFNKAGLTEYVNRQLGNFFPDGKDTQPVITKNLDESLDRLFFSLKHVKLQGYTNFNVLHSDLYAQWLYFLSNTVWNNDQDKNCAGKLYYLNKALNGLNCMYDTKLPNIFLLIHCVGSMLGKANYANYFVACHNVTVGTDRGNSPSMEEGVYMGPGSSIIGNCQIGQFTHLTVNAAVLNQNTEGSCIVIGSSPGFESKKISRNLVREQYFILD